ncbi:hypothetical protein [Bdellovibrio bacteriovorus]|uniref:hypothetical protein n=1 Tax=Bdellovibrio bacteriovorus TaxID=959 RepID=UPI0035A90E43
MSLGKVAVVMWSLLLFSSFSWAQDQNAEAQLQQIEQQPLPQQPEPNSQSNVLNEKVHDLQTQIDSLKKDLQNSKIENRQDKVTDQKEIPVQNEEENSLMNLRKRSHALSWQYIAISSESTATENGSSSSWNSSSGALNFGYMRNLGMYEFGVSLTSQYLNSENIETTSTALWVIGELNFIENKPGADFIPYMSGQVGLVGMKTEAGSSDYEISGTGAAIGVGFKWIPFSEIFALDLSLKVGSAKMDNIATPKLELEVRRAELSVGWRLYF